MNSQPHTPAPAPPPEDKPHHTAQNSTVSIALTEKLLVGLNRGCAGSGLGMTDLLVRLRSSHSPKGVGFALLFGDWLSPLELDVVNHTRAQ